MVQCFNSWYQTRSQHKRWHGPSVWSLRQVAHKTQHRQTCVAFCDGSTLLSTKLYGLNFKNTDLLSVFTRLYNASVQSFGLNTGLMVMPEWVCSAPLTGGWTWVMSWLVFQIGIWSQSRFVEQGVYFESAGFPICVTTVLGCSPCICLPSVPTPLSGLNKYFEK